LVCMRCKMDRYISSCFGKGLAWKIKQTPRISREQLSNVLVIGVCVCVYVDGCVRVCVCVVADFLPMACVKLWNFLISFCFRV
jgi:hypothetical protein